MFQCVITNYFFDDDDDEVEVDVPAAAAAAAAEVEVVAATGPVELLARAALSCAPI